MDKGLTVLSLFDGISCGRIALERAGIEVAKYYASEIKKIAIETTMLHYPDTIQIGDVTKVSYENGVLYTEKGQFEVGNVDLLIGGSPCQDFSILRAASGLEITGLKGAKSKLFYEYLRLLSEVKPRFFLLENVRMKRESEEQLNEYLGVKGIFINSILVSYQNRPRIYWTNIPNVVPPEDRKINFQTFRERETTKNSCPIRSTVHQAEKKCGATVPEETKPVRVPMLHIQTIFSALLVNKTDFLTLGLSSSMVSAVTSLVKNWNEVKHFPSVIQIISHTIKCKMYAETVGQSMLSLISFVLPNLIYHKHALRGWTSC